MQNLIGRFIKHKTSNDVCYQILNCYEGDSNFKLKVNIINMGFTKSFKIFDMPKRIEIKKSELNNWLALLDVDINQCYRNCKTEALNV